MLSTGLRLTPKRASSPLTASVTELRGRPRSSAALVKLHTNAKSSQRRLATNHSIGSLAGDRSDWRHLGGFKRSSQHDLCRLIGETGQAPLRVSSNQASFGAAS